MRKSGRPARRGWPALFRTFAAALTALCFVFPFSARAQDCSIETRPGVPDAEFDAIFTQNGPGRGLEPAGAPGWTGGDSTYSILLPGGETAFFFSDSYIGESPTVKGDGTVFPNAAGLRMRVPNCPAAICGQPAAIHSASNSIVVSSRDGKKLTTKVGPPNRDGVSTSYLKPAAPDHFFWLGDAAVVPVDRNGAKKLWIFLFEWRTNKPGEAFRLDFKGNYLAQLDAATLAVESVRPLANLKDANTHWGAALWFEGDRGESALYIYGKKTVDGKKKPFVARVDPRIGLERASDTGNWSVWDGRGWTRDLAAASSLVPENDSVSDELSVKKFIVGGRPRYLMVALDTREIYFNWKDIYLYSACRPEGPFRDKSLVYTTPETGARKLPGMTAEQQLENRLVVYNPHLHPQFTENGRLLISYNSNLPFASPPGDTIYADVYRPRFVRVPVAGLKSPKSIKP